VGGLLHSCELVRVVATAAVAAVVVAVSIIFMW